MSNRKKRAASLLIAAALFLSLIPATSLAYDAASVPRLVFSGIEVNTVSESGGDDPTYQVLYALKVTGQDIDTAGFTLRYDGEYLQPSDAETNEVIRVDAGDALEPMLKLDGTLQQTAMALRSINYAEYTETAGTSFGLLSCGIYVTSSDVGQKNALKGTQPGGAEIGVLSFRIAPEKLSALNSMTTSELKELVCLYTENPDTQALMVGWTDDDDESDVYTDLDLWEVNMALELPPLGAVANLLEDEVTAYGLYGLSANPGTETDLFEYIRANSTSVTVTYLGGSVSVEPFTWDPAEMSIAGGAAYDLRSGVYTVRQTDEQLGEVSVEVTVTPVNITGFLAETNDYICYDPDAAPADISGITDFPTEARVLYDVSLPAAAKAVVGIDAGTWAQTAPDEVFNDPAKPSYTFTANVSADDIPAWATYDSGAVPATVDVVRFVGPQADKPVVQHAEVNDSGELIIMVEALTPGPDDRGFVVRLPDGTTMAPDSVSVAAGEHYTGSDGVEYTGVKVTVSPNGAEIAKEYFNLGGAGFEIAVQAREDAPAYGRSEFESFSVAARNNYFTTDGAGYSAADGAYSFDYSGINKGRYPFTQGTTLPASFALPAMDYVTSTYDGGTGTEPGKLQQFAVQWDAAPVSGDPALAGEDVVFTGTLLDTTTPEGDITNPNGIKIRVKVTTLEIATYGFVLKTDPADGSRGTAAIKDAETPMSASIAAGETVTVVVTPLDGYRFAGWTAVPGTVTPTKVGGTEDEWSFEMPSSNLSLTARFTEDSAGLSDISVYDAEDGTATHALHSYSDGLGGVVSFDPETNEYYVQVPAATAEVRLLVSATVEPTVTYESDSETTPVASPVTDDGAGGFETGAIPLNATSPELGTPPGFNNVVKIDDGANMYTIYIQRLVAARIELAYGNSPYGMIMRSEVITDKDAAKQAFLASDTETTGDDNRARNLNLHFTDGFTPTDMIDATMSADTWYTTVAWAGVKDKEGAAVNYDLDDYAVFAYTGESFVDPGFTVYDEEGNDVTATGSITVSDIENVAVLESAGTPTFRETTTTTLTRGENGTYTMNGLVRTGVYYITYRFTYTPIGATDPVTVEIERPVILLNRVFDTKYDDTVYIDSDDSTGLKNNWSTWAGMETESDISIFLYRVCDTKKDANPYIDSDDSTELKNSWSNPSKQIQYYKSCVVETA